MTYRLQVRPSFPTLHADHLSGQPSSFRIRRILRFTICRRKFNLGIFSLFFLTLLTFHTQDSLAGVCTPTKVPTWVQCPCQTSACPCCALHGNCFSPEISFT